VNLYHEALLEESIYQALHVADTVQTIACTKRPKTCYEAEQPFVAFAGHHPSERQVYQYMAAEALSHAAVTAVLIHYHMRPAALRIWEGISIGVAMVDVHQNFRAGLQIRF
jgi:hypothetical protein